MSALSDLILSIYPGNGSVGVPLLSDIVITLSGLNYDEDSLKEGLFVEGPDTDQYVGPGLLDLTTPQNVSQGDLDDFLQSPGYQGIVVGTATVTGIGGNTIVTFDPNLPLSASTEYQVNLTEVLDSSLDSIEGFVTSSFTAGSGSIEEIPSTLSTTVLTGAVTESAALTEPLQIVRMTPADVSIGNDVTLQEIVIEFNKPINEASLVGNIVVNTLPATDHPNLSIRALGEIAFSTVIEGNLVKIKI